MSEGRMKGKGYWAEGRVGRVEVELVGGKKGEREICEEGKGRREEVSAERVKKRYVL